MSYLKLITSPILIATLTSSVLANFTSIANARPDSEQVAPNTQMSGYYEMTGNLFKGHSTVDDISCDKISVTLIEYIPTKPPYMNKKSVVQPVSATGNHLREGCTYSLVFSYLPRIRPYGESTFFIEARAGEIIGSKLVSYPFPNQIDLYLFPPNPPPE